MQLMPQLESLLASFSINYNYWILQSIAMGLTCFFIRGLSLSSPLGAIFMVVGLAYVNSMLWDAALFFKLPDSLSMQVVTLSLANGCIFWVLVKLLPGIEVQGIVPALVAPIVFTITSLIISSYLQDVDWLTLGQAGINRVQSLRDSMGGTTTPHPAPTP